MKVYGALIYMWDYMKVLMSNKEIVKAIKSHHGAAVMEGFDPQRYIACIVFNGKQDRDEFGRELDRMGITFDTRDDGYIDDKFVEEWK